MVLSSGHTVLLVKCHLGGLRDRPAQSKLYEQFEKILLYCLANHSLDITGRSLRVAFVYIHGIRAGKIRSQITFLRAGPKIGYFQGSRYSFHTGNIVTRNVKTKVVTIFKSALFIIIDLPNISLVRVFALLLSLSEDS